MSFTGPRKEKRAPCQDWLQTAMYCFHTRPFRVWRYLVRPYSQPCSVYLPAWLPKARKLTSVRRVYTTIKGILRTPWSWQKYCLNHCARTCCSLRIVTRCRFTNWPIRCERGGRNGAVAIRPRHSECKSKGARPVFHVHVSAGAFQRAFRERKNVFQCTRKRVCGIRLVVARHFTVYTTLRSCACVLHPYGQHARGKAAHRAVFPRIGKVSASGNAFMEMVTDYNMISTRF